MIGVTRYGSLRGGKRPRRSGARRSSWVRTRRRVEPRGRKGRKDIADVATSQLNHRGTEAQRGAQRHRTSQPRKAAELAAVFDRRHRDGVCPIRTRAFVPATHRPGPLCSEHSGSACAMRGLPYPLIFWEGIGRAGKMPAPQFGRVVLWSRLPACLMDGVGVRRYRKEADTVHPLPLLLPLPLPCSGVRFVVLTSQGRRRGRGKRRGDSISRTFRRRTNHQTRGRGRCGRGGRRRARCPSNRVPPGIRSTSRPRGTRGRRRRG